MILGLVCGGTVLALAVVGWLGWSAQKAKTEAIGQLARNYWQSSHVERDAGHDLEALHFAAEAIRLNPPTAQSVFLDMRETQRGVQRARC